MRNYSEISHPVICNVGGTIFQVFKLVALAEFYMYLYSLKFSGCYMSNYKLLSWITQKYTFSFNTLLPQVLYKVLTVILLLF